MFFSTIKNILFPIYCLNCDKEGEWLCVDCRLKVESNFQNYKAVNSLDGLTVFFDYNEKSIVGKLIKLLKYNYVRELARVISDVISAKVYLESPPAGKKDSYTIIPVPLHPRRKRERGFNQAEILANIFADKFGMANIQNGILQRVKYTIQQAKLKREDRQQNLKGAFAIKKGTVVPKNILLIDDVYTTGATMQACAKVLKQNGAQKVFGMVLARGL